MSLRAKDEAGILRLKLSSQSFRLVWVVSVLINKYTWPCVRNPIARDERGGERAGQSQVKEKNRKNGRD